MANDASDEDDSFDWSTDIEHGSTTFCAEGSSSSAKAYPTGYISCNSKVIINRFVAMGFSERIVAKAIEENGEDDEASILDSLLTYAAIQESAQECQSIILEPWPPETESYNIADDVSDMDSSPDIALENPLEMEKKDLLSLLLDMGYPAEEALTAIDKCGQDAEIAELTDFICAAKMEKELESHPLEFYDESENSYSHGRSRNHDFPSKKRKLPKDVKKKGGWCLGSDGYKQYETEDRVYIPHPMIGYGVPDEQLPLVERKLPEAAQGPPYFYFENVAFAPRGTWSKMSRFLYDIEPEFVDSVYFCACARKRGYIHNLPIHNRFPLLPRPPRTIQEALPWTKQWWPLWDSRTKLNCIVSCHGTGKLTERIRQALERYDGDEPPPDVKKFVLEQCRKWNLVWVGRNKVAALEFDELEMLLGYPKNHTRGGGTNVSDRSTGLGNTFQIDTVAYHLSVLKERFPNGINVLSLFSGIGGAEVALHRLGIHLKNVVSVEISEINRNTMRSWWAQTNQCGTLIEVADVREVTGGMLEQWISLFGGFDLVIGGSPCNNLSGMNRSTRVGLDGKHSSLFFEYFRILDLVKCIMGKI